MPTKEIYDPSCSRMEVLNPFCILSVTTFSSPFNQLAVHSIALSPLLFSISFISPELELQHTFTFRCHNFVFWLIRRFPSGLPLSVQLALGCIFFPTTNCVSSFNKLEYSSNICLRSSQTHSSFHAYSSGLSPILGKDWRLVLWRDFWAGDTPGHSWEGVTCETQANQKM